MPNPVAFPVERFECDCDGRICRIYRIRTQVFPHLAGYVCLVLADPGKDGRPFPPTLIDAGSGEGSSPVDILDGLEKVRTRFGEPFVPTDVERIFLSHTHFDHFGGAGRLSAFLNAEIGAHPCDARVVCAQDERANVLNAAFRRFLAMAGIDADQGVGIIQAFGFTPGRVRSAPVARMLTDGECVDGLIRVHHTPGHSPGHLCFEIGPYLLLGDLLLSRTVTQIWPQTLIPGTGLERHLRSLDKLVQIAERMRSAALAHGGLTPIGLAPIGLPGHEDVIGNIPLRVEGIRRNHRRRCARLLAVLERADHPLCIAEIAARMYVNGPLSRLLMPLADAAGRVEYLEHYGRVAVANHESLGDSVLPVYRYIIP
ncbi:MAG TPA: hypothetical protein DEB39_08545 [Planctomycetaceae bacterium]|nr:hypothetical protein [Planctomycetaceae bacterium]